MEATGLTAVPCALGGSPTWPGGLPPEKGGESSLQERRQRLQWQRGWDGAGRAWGWAGAHLGVCLGKGLGRIRHVLCLQQELKSEEDQTHAWEILLLLPNKWFWLSK